MKMVADRIGFILLSDLAKVSPQPASSACRIITSFRYTVAGMGGRLRP
ncbi:MAG: hypothetical protein LBJ00_00785 [Planctomycetaceae bacterium]|nr:hypothetical protein [Planctomycetaceae bacterium]